MVTRLLLLTSVLAFSGCYVEDVEDRSQTPSKRQNSSVFEATSSNDSCEMSARTGCFEGQITSAPNIFVNGIEFFDAEDLANRFDQIIDITNDEGVALVRDQDYQVELLTPFDNKNFTEKFEIYIKGDLTDTANIRSSGSFYFNNLPKGEYEVRVQRPIKFKVAAIQKQPSEAEAEADAQPEEEVAVEAEEKVYCATLYQDVAIEISPGERSLGQVFDSFKLYITDVQCPENRTDRTIKL